ncbi:hypothetical protein C5167_013500, partial [Papaver somniferum]
DTRIAKFVVHPRISENGTFDFQFEYDGFVKGHGRFGVAVSNRNGKLLLSNVICTPLGYWEIAVISLPSSKVVTCDFIRGVKRHNFMTPIYNLSLQQVFIESIPIDDHLCRYTGRGNNIGKEERIDDHLTDTTKFLNARYESGIVFLSFNLKEALVVITDDVGYDTVEIGWDKGENGVCHLQEIWDRILELTLLFRTTDDDFGMLLEASVMYDRQVSAIKGGRDGKGPEKEKYEKQIKS